MKSDELQYIVDTINEISSIPEVGGRLGVSEEVINNHFIISNKNSVKDSHYNCKIDTYNDAIQIINELFKNEYVEGVVALLDEESDYSEDKQLYFHYLKSMKI